MGTESIAKEQEMEDVKRKQAIEVVEYYLWIEWEKYLNRLDDNLYSGGNGEFNTGGKI